jgi:hypothetical protein
VDLVSALEQERKGISQFVIIRASEKPFPAVTNTWFRRVKNGTNTTGYLKIPCFKVLKAVSIKMAVSWVVVPCSLVEVYQ